MFYQLHTLLPRAIAPSTASALGSKYPIAMTLDKFMDAWTDVKSFNMSAVAFVDRTLAQGFGATSIAESLQNIQNANNNTDTLLFSGFSRRTLGVLGLMNPNGTELVPSQVPNAATEYPVHTISNPIAGTVSINFGKSVYRDGLFFPEIVILFANGMGSTAAGVGVGNINFGPYGSIPIFGGSAVSGVAIGTVSGNIIISERFSSLKAQNLQIRPGDSVSLATTSSMRNLIAYKKAFFGSASATVAAESARLTVTVPANAKSGPIRFETDGSPYDAFLSSMEFTVTS